MNISELRAGKELSAHELNVKIAIEIMKWNYWDFKGDYEGEFPMFTYVGESALAVYFDHGDRHSYFDPSHDISAAYQMEERIAELGLIEEYCFQLNAIANTHLDRDYYRQPQRWQLIHATPEDRCLAALAAVEKTTGSFMRAQGIIPWQDGDELPEDTIRRYRDNE